MIIKKFTANTMREALNQIRKELGEDAVILQSKQVEKTGLLNFLGKQMIEITAATQDYHPVEEKRVNLNDDQRDDLAPLFVDHVLPILRRAA